MTLFSQLERDAVFDRLEKERLEIIKSVKESGKHMSFCPLRRRDQIYFLKCVCGLQQILDAKEAK